MRKTSLACLLALSLASPLAAAEFKGDALMAKQLFDQFCQKELLQGDCTIYAVAAYKDWGYFAWKSQEAEGMGLARQTSKGWRKVVAGGGAMALDDIIAHGAPVSVAARLMEIMLGRQVAYAPRDRRLKEADLQHKTPWELILMRNEIYARHGRAFLNPQLQEYFSAQTWYKINPKYSYRMLSELEQHNIAFIQLFEGKQKR